MKLEPLSLRETELKEEMKNNCLTKGQYIDKNAEEKFKMLCHLEDFEIEYWKLQKEVKQLKKQVTEYQDEIFARDNSWYDMQE